MITLPDGTPQFEGLGTLRALNINTVNSQLREWSAQRRCMNCSWNGRVECEFFRVEFDDRKFNPETFSCAAFEMKHVP